MQTSGFRDDALSTELVGRSLNCKTLPDKPGLPTVSRSEKNGATAKYGTGSKRIEKADNSICSRTRLE